MSNKWSISTDEERYDGQYDTIDEAIAAGKANGHSEFWVGQCVPPTPPELLFTNWSVERWIDSDVWSDEEYSGSWAEDSVKPTPEQIEELAEEIRPLIAAWLDRHNLRPQFWNIDPMSVRQVNVESEEESDDE